MNRISRRALSVYAVDQLVATEKPAKLAKSLAALLAESGRSEEVDFLLADIAYELESRHILTNGKVTTAHPLTKELETAIKKQLKTITSSDEVSLEKQIDKSVLGGIKVETSSRIWDETLRRKISDLREAN